MDRKGIPGGGLGGEVLQRKFILYEASAPLPQALSDTHHLQLDNLDPHGPPGDISSLLRVPVSTSTYLQCRLWRAGCLQPARDRLSQDTQRRTLNILKGREWAEECIYGGNISRTGTARAQLETVCSHSQC